LYLIPIGNDTYNNILPSYLLSYVSIFVYFLKNDINYLTCETYFVPLCTEIPGAVCASSGVLNAIRIMRMRSLGGRGSGDWA